MNFKNWFLSLVVSLLSMASFAQDEFEGIVVYAMEYQNLSEEMKAYKEALPTEITMYFKDDKVRIEQTTIKGNQIVITDRKAKETVILMDLMGDKIALKVPTEDYQQQAEAMKDQRVEYIEGSKTVAGFECKKAIITNTQSGKKVTVYYAEEFENPGNQFIALKGFPLAYEENGTDGMVTLLTATEINKKSVGDNYFEVPEGYKLMTQEELQEMYNGLGQ